MPSAIGSRYNAGNQKNEIHSSQSYQQVARRPPMEVCGSINELAIVQICTMPEPGRLGSSIRYIVAITFLLNRDARGHYLRIQTQAHPRILNGENLILEHPSIRRSSRAYRAFYQRDLRYAVSMLNPALSF